MGNRALQYLVAAAIRQHAPDAVIEDVHLDEWDMTALHAEPIMQGSICTGLMRFWLDVPGLGDCLRRGEVESVLVDGYNFHVDNFPSRALSRTLLGPTRGGASATGFAADELVCSIRGAEVLQRAHPDYILLPPSYYAMLAERSGLKLVFFGQIGDDPYSRGLRQALPSARFVAGQNPEYDFEMLRRSVNIALSISTFAWLAAWLSDAEQIYLPVCGMFSPVQSPNMSFLPLDDPAFKYTLFPYAQAVNLYEDPLKFHCMQAVLEQHMTPVTSADLQSLSQRAAILVPRQPLLSGFDAAYYLRCYPDIEQALSRGTRSALDHYWHIGFNEGRRPFDMDPLYYASSYPDAAWSIATGEYANPIHHYQAVGRAKSYRPTP